MRAEDLVIIAAIVILAAVSLISFAKAHSLKETETGGSSAKSTGAPAGKGAVPLRTIPAAGSSRTAAGKTGTAKKTDVPAGTAARYKTTMERSIRTRQVRSDPRNTDLQLLFQEHGGNVFWSCGNCGLENPGMERACPLCGELRA